MSSTVFEDMEQQFAEADKRGLQLIEVVWDDRESFPDDESSGFDQLVTRSVPRVGEFIELGNGLEVEVRRVVHTSYEANGWRYLAPRVYATVNRVQESSKQFKVLREPES